MTSTKDDSSLTVWVDRFISASSASDARDSLEELVQALQEPHLIEEEETPLWHNHDLLEPLLHLLETGQHHPTGVELEQGRLLALQSYLNLLPTTTTTTAAASSSSSMICVACLSAPGPPGRLLQAVVDVLCTASEETYTRIVALRLLQKCGTQAPSLCQTQLLEQPNGLHRLADLLQEPNVAEPLVLEFLTTARATVALWPPCAKVWLFAEVADTLLLRVQTLGGFTQTANHIQVLDCLSLLETLVQSDNASLANLLWESPHVAPPLAALLDLRQGEEFRHPPVKSNKTDPTARPKDDDDDDLDAILARGSGAASAPDTNETASSSITLPHLTRTEEEVIRKVFQLVRLLLESETVHPSDVWKQHGVLGSLLWELALVTEPSDGKAVCALPSRALQQEALELIAQVWNDPDTLQRHMGMDRLLYLVCTGGGGGAVMHEKLGLSQAALFVLRRTVSPETASQVVLYTLAPAPTEDDDDPQQQPPPTVLQKLLNTILEQISDDATTPTTTDESRPPPLQLVGALGAVGMLISSHGNTSRDVLLKIVSSQDLVSVVWEFLERKDTDPVAAVACLRFFAEWMVETPAVVEALLCSHASTTTVSALWSSSNVIISTLTGFLLGLAMEYMGEGENYGGWTRQSILGLISKRGVSQYTAGLEKLDSAESAASILPWKVCEPEWKLFWEWYMDQVRVIRRRVVQELTAGSDDPEEEEEGEEEEEHDGEAVKRHKSAVKSLNRLVAQQAAELEELRTCVHDRDETIKAQQEQLSAWKRRMESNPTQLDDLLNEYTERNSNLEKTIQGLEKTLQETKEKFESQLVEQKEETSKVQQDLRESQDREEEAREERDLLRSEMEGLSAAYSTLETEYNRQLALAGSSTGSPTGEQTDAGVGQQPQGEASHQDQTRNSELEGLRAENERLRSDARAADDWMAMAVQRMNDIGGQNLQLQEQVASLQKNVSTDGGDDNADTSMDSTAIAEIKNQLRLEQENRQTLEERIRELDIQKTSLEHEVSTLSSLKADGDPASIRVDDLEHQLQDERGHRERLEVQLANAQKDVETALESLGTAKSEREDLERSLGVVEKDFNIARAEIISLTEERQQLEGHRAALSDLHAMEVKVEALQTERNALESTKNEEIKSLMEAVNSKEEELSTTRKELTQLRSQEPEPLIVDSASSDEKVSTLQNQAAVLNETVQSLQNELGLVREELRNASEREQAEVDKRNLKIQELEAQLLQAQQTSTSPGQPADAAGIFSKTAEIASSSDAQNFFSAGGAVSDPREEELIRLRADIEAAQEWMSKAVEHHQMLAEQVEALTADKAALVKEVKDARTQLKNASSEHDAVEGMRIQLEELQAKLRIAEEEKESAANKLSELERKHVEMMSEREAALEQATGLRKELDDIQKDVAEREAFVDKANQQADELKSQISQLETDRLELQEELDAAKEGCLEAAQLRIALQKAHDECLELREKEEAIKTESMSLRQSNSGVQLLEAELEDSKQAYEQLEKSKASIESALEDLKKENAELDDVKKAHKDLLGELEVTKADNEFLILQRDSQGDTIDGLGGQISELEALNAELLEEKRAIGEQLAKLNGEEKERKSLELDSLVGENTALKQAQTALESTVGELETKCASLLERNTVLEQELETFKLQANDSSSLSATLAKLEEQLKLKDENIKRADDDISQLRADLEVIKTQSEDVVGQWSERASELESTVRELEEALQVQQDEASEAIAQWTARCSEVETQSNELSLRLEKVSVEKNGLAQSLLEANESMEIHNATISSLQEELVTAKDGLGATSELEARLQKISNERDKMAQLLEEANASAEIQNSAVGSLQEELGVAQNNLAAASDVLAEERNSHKLKEDALASQLERVTNDALSLNGELQQVKSKLVSGEEKWNGNVSELEATIVDLEQALEERQDEAAAAIAQWEAHCGSIEEENEKLQSALRGLTDQKEDVSASWKSEKEALRMVIDEEKASNSRLEHEVMLLNEQLDEMREQSEEVINAWKERVEELEANVNELEEILELQREQATDAISQWESRCSTIDEKASNLDRALTEAMSDFAAYLQMELETRIRLLVSVTSSAFPSSMSATEGESSEALVTSLKSQIEETNEQLTDALNSLVNEKSELLAKCETVEESRQEISILRAEIAEFRVGQETEEKSKIDVLESAIANEKERSRDLESVLEKEREVLSALEKELLEVKSARQTDEVEHTVELSAQLAAKEAADKSVLAFQDELASLKRRLEESRAERSHLEEMLEAERMHEHEDESNLRLELNSNVEEKIYLLQERDELKALAGQLEEELREANDTLQACVTDEVSERAAEVAAQELRRQMEQYRLQIQREREALSSSEEARLEAEKEIEQLKADLAVLLRMKEGDRDISGQLKRTVMESSNKARSRERQEIEELRKALERALQELESSKAAERMASEKASASRLQVSVCEQETIASKSDLTFLTQTMEEIREAETTRKAALEYRISALEDDREILRRLHADELENLRNELAQVHMEKDRILHLLKDSEKKIAAMIHSSSQEHRDEEATSPESELHRLRIEKAELLAAIAEEGSKVERRIREAVAAQAASMEADVILEKELRTAAEASADDVKKQLKDLQEQVAASNRENTESAPSEEYESTRLLSEKLSSDLNRYQEETERLTAENSALLGQLDGYKFESSVRHTELTEKLRVAQAKLHKLEREKRFDSELKSEMRKLQSDASVGVPGRRDNKDSLCNWIVIRNNDQDPAEENEENEENERPVLGSATEAYDFIHKQKIAIQEERAMYLELLAEHDDLLALLAQQDLEKSSLQSALGDIAGDDAVKAAIQEAESNAIKRFGKYVKLS